jgi:hypothetical protein
MNLTLSDEQREVLAATLDLVLSELTTEIADTENPAYRRTLHVRRDRLVEIKGMLAQPGSAG